MRLIDADVAAKEFMVLAKEPDYQHEDEDWRSGLYMAEEALYRLPAVDIAESIYEDLKAMVLMTDIPHGSEPAEENVEAVMWWQVSKYFKDRFNVGDYEEDDYDDEDD